MKLTDAQLQMTEEALHKLTNSFRNGELARSYKEHERNGKRLLWAGPRIIRNCKMLVDEIKYMRQEREQMVEVMKEVHESLNNGASHEYEETVYYCKTKLLQILKQVGELE